MSRLNRRTTKVPQAEPVAVTRAKRLLPKKAVPPAPAPFPTRPTGIFYQQEEAPYRLPRGLFNPSAANKTELNMGKKSARVIDSAINEANLCISKAFDRLNIASGEIAKLTDEDSDMYKGFSEMLGEQANNISFKSWTGLLLGQSGILENLNAMNDALKNINSFVSNHNDEEWNIHMAKFIEGAEDGAVQTMEELKHLKKAQANAMLVRQAVNELHRRRKEETDINREAEAEQNLRMQELEDLIKKHNEEVSALLEKNSQALHEKTKEQIAKDEEVSEAAQKAQRLLKKSVREARRQVAIGVTEYANTIAKDDDEPSQE